MNNLLYLFLNYIYILDSNYGISTPVMFEATLGKTMVNIAKKIIVVVDYSKFGRRSFAKIADISSIDIIITDKNITKEEEAKFNNFNLEFIKV